MRTGTSAKVAAMTRGSGGRRRGSRRRPRRSPRSGTPSRSAGGQPPPAVWRAARTPDRAARGCPWHWRRRRRARRQAASPARPRGPGLARRCRDGAVVQPAVEEAQQHAVVRADLDWAGEAEALGCAADDAPGDAAVEQAVGRADDVAALDRQPLGAHLPADAAAVMDLPRGLEIAFGGGLRGRGDAGERQRGGERGRAGEARHGAADGVLLPVEGGLGIAADDLLSAPGLEGLVVDPRGRETGAGDEAAASVDAASVPAIYPGRVGGRARRGPARAVPHRHQLGRSRRAGPGGRRAGRRRGCAAPGGSAGVVGGVGLVGAQGRPGELIQDPLVIPRRRQAAQADVVGLAGDGVIEIEGDRAAVGRPLVPDEGLPMDPPGGDGALDPVRGVERRAGGRIDVAGDERDPIAGGRPLAGHLRIVVQRCRADLTDHDPALQLEQVGHRLARGDAAVPLGAVDRFHDRLVRLQVTPHDRAQQQVCRRHDHALDRPQDVRDGIGVRVIDRPLVAARQRHLGAGGIGVLVEGQRRAALLAIDHQQVGQEHRRAVERIGRRGRRVPHIVVRDRVLQAVVLAGAGLLGRAEVHQDGPPPPADPGVRHREALGERIIRVPVLLAHHRHAREHLVGHIGPVRIANGDRRALEIDRVGRDNGIGHDPS